LQCITNCKYAAGTTKIITLVCKQLQVSGLFTLVFSANKNKILPSLNLKIFKANPIE